MLTTKDIIQFDYLYESLLKCRKNVSWKTSVQSFLLNDIDRLDALADALADGTYKEKPQKKFKVYEPKERDITSLAFVDRIYQRSLNDNLVYPQMTKSLIYDNVACQHGKGTDFGRRRLKCHLQKHFKKYGLNGYVLQTDIKGYYPNMSHKAVEAKFKRHLDPDTFERVKVILDSFEGDYGYEAGSQMIQIAGISLLDDVDHYAKEQLRIKHYIRYMDDTIILCPTKEIAEEWLEKLRVQYAKVECDLHPTKTKIYPITKTITYLGFDFKLLETGKVLQIANRKRIRRKKVKYNKMLKRIYFPIEGKAPVTTDKFIECLGSYFANLHKGDSYNVVKDFRNYIIERNRIYVQEFNAKRGETTSTD